MNNTKSDGLHLRLVGTVNDPSLLENLRHRSENIHVVGRKFALVYFREEKDGSFKLPESAPDLDKMKVSIQVENTFEGARIFAIDEKGRIRETKEDTIQEKWSEKCMIGFGGTVLRMHECGKVEVYDVTLVKQLNEVFIDRSNLLEILLPINNDVLLDARIKKYEILEQFRQKLKAAIGRLRHTEEAKETPPTPEEKEEEPKETPKVEEESKEESKEEMKEETEETSPPPILEVPEEKDPKKEKKKSKPKKKTTKKTPEQKNATIQKKKNKEEDQKEADKLDIEEVDKPDITESIPPEIVESPPGSDTLTANLLESLKKA